MDLETRISGDLPERLTSLPPKNFKKEEIIAAWKLKRDEEIATFYAEIEERQALDVGLQRQELIEKSALKWWEGQIVCIGYSHMGNFGEIYGGDEEEILTKFASMVDSKHIDEFVGKSSDFFDRGFLIGRYMAHENLFVPRWLKDKSFHFDVDNIFGYGRTSQKTSLNNYAKGLNVPCKSGHGTDVAKWVAIGDWKSITEYCRQDVKITEEMYLRYVKEPPQYVQ